MKDKTRTHGLKGRPMPLETRAKIAASKMGVPRTEEAKANISKGKKGKKRDPSDGVKISAGLIRYNQEKRRLKPE